MTVGRIIINSTLTLSIAASITLMLGSIVYADREKQLEQAQVLAARFHEHEIAAKEIVADLKNRDSLTDQRVAQLNETLLEVRKDVKTLLERIR